MNSQIPRIEIKPGYSISRIIKGGWHLAGGHGTVDKKQAIEDMRAFVEAGITTFDCADIYSSVEELIGNFISHYKEAFASGDLPPIQIHTKYVPDYDRLAALTKRDTQAAIDRSLVRLGVERLDMVQFAWWNYAIPGYVETALHLTELRKAGKIRHLAVTNVDAAHLRELLEAGVEVVANQVQYSVLDHRPAGDLVKLAKEHGVWILCYGVVAGGFLSDRYLGVPEPDRPLENRSLVKYRLIIDEFGGYDLFQRVLLELKEIADKHNVSIAQVAMQYILQKPRVGGIIIGARNVDHLQSFQALHRLHLDDEDLQQIHKVTATAQGPSGPVYELEGDKESKHGSIMRYNLNEQ